MFYAEKPEFATAYPLIPKGEFTFTIDSPGAEDLAGSVFTGRIIDPVMANQALDEGVLEFAGREFVASPPKVGRYTTSLVSHDFDFEIEYGKRKLRTLCIPGKVLVFTPDFNGSFATTYRPDFFASKLTSGEFKLA